MSALLKLLVQLCAAGVAVCFGVVIDQITIFGAVIEFGVFAIPITLLWIVGLSNAINLIDGLDGLACGVSAITSLSILAVVLITGDMTSALITAILVGACGGFLPYNRNPASIFMGDTGALFLGYTLAVISVQGVFKLHTVLSFLVPFSIFALPLFDTLVAIVRRLIHGQSPFHPDRGHLHHKLVDMGFTHKEAVRLLYAISGIMGLVAVTYTDAMFHESRGWKSMIIAVAAVIILVLNFLCLRKPSTRILSGLAEHISEKKLAEEKTEGSGAVSEKEENTDGEKHSGDKEL